MLQKIVALQVFTQVTFKFDYENKKTLANICN